MSEFDASFEITKKINVKITCSDFELGQNENFTHSPEKIIDNDNFDGSRRWAAYGPLHWINFDFDQTLTFYGLDIAWYKGNESKTAFEITSRTVPEEKLWKGKSTGYLGSYETYKFNDQINTKNIKIICHGNEWNMITSVKFRLDPIQEDGIEPFPDCPEGKHWHDTLQKCVDNTISKPPEVKILTPLLTVKQGDSVELNGSQTTDPEGAGLRYIWTQIGGDLIPTSSKSEPNLIFRVPTVDTELAFRLTVTNTGNLSSSADARIVVRADPHAEILKQVIEKVNAPLTMRTVNLKELEPAVPATKPKRKQKPRKQ